MTNCYLAGIVNVAILVRPCSPRSPSRRLVSKNFSTGCARSPRLSLKSSE